MIHMLENEIFRIIRSAGNDKGYEYAYNLLAEFIEEIEQKYSYEVTRPKIKKEIKEFLNKNEKYNAITVLEELFDVKTLKDLTEIIFCIIEREYYNEEICSRTGKNVLTAFGWWDLH